MRFFVFLALLLGAALTSIPVYASQADARAIALINNCTPKKIDVYDNSLSESGKTTYQVTCNMPKTTDKDAPSDAPDSLLIGCDGSMCDVIRAVPSAAK